MSQGNESLEYLFSPFFSYLNTVVLPVAVFDALSGGPSSLAASLYVMRFLRFLSISLLLSSLVSILLSVNFVPVATMTFSVAPIVIVRPGSYKKSSEKSRQGKLSATA